VGEVGCGGREGGGGGIGRGGSVGWSGSCGEGAVARHKSSLWHQGGELVGEVDCSWGCLQSARARREGWCGGFRVGRGVGRGGPGARRRGKRAPALLGPARGGGRGRYRGEGLLGERSPRTWGPGAVGDWGRRWRWAEGGVATRWGARPRWGASRAELLSFAARRGGVVTRVRCPSRQRGVGGRTSIVVESRASGLGVGGRLDAGWGGRWERAGGRAGRGLGARLARGRGGCQVGLTGGDLCGGRCAPCVGAGRGLGGPRRTRRGGGKLAGSVVDPLAGRGAPPPLCPSNTPPPSHEHPSHHSPIRPPPLPPPQRSGGRGVKMVQPRGSGGWTGIGFGGGGGGRLILWGGAGGGCGGWAGAIPGGGGGGGGGTLEGRLLGAYRGSLPLPP